MNHGLAKQHSTFAPLSLSLYCGGSRNPQAFQKRTWAENPALKKKGHFNSSSSPAKSAKQPPTHTETAGPICNGKGPSCWKPRNNNWSLTMSVLVVWVLVIIILEKKQQNEVDEVLNNLNNLKTLFSCFVGVLPKRNMKKYSMCTLPEDGA